MVCWSLTTLKTVVRHLGCSKTKSSFLYLLPSYFYAVIAYVLVKVPLQKKYNRIHILLVMIAGGAIGNLIDRLRLDYVVDFIYIVLINFPIFNVADMYVTFSTVIFDHTCPFCV